MFHVMACRMKPGARTERPNHLIDGISQKAPRAAPIYIGIDPRRGREEMGRILCPGDGFELNLSDVPVWP